MHIDQISVLEPTFECRCQSKNLSTTCFVFCLDVMYKMFEVSHAQVQVKLKNVH